MKYKDVLRNSLYLDEELQDYFNEMSKKGWRLDFVGYYYRFIKDEHVYKYQIDYTPISSEYQDILKEMGYHEVRNSFDDFRVLENENVDAPDLNTEFVFDKNNKMKQFKKIRYFIYPILAYFLFWLGKIFIKDIVEIGKPVLYYEGFGSLLMGIVFIVLSFVLLFVTILNFSILYALKNDKDLKSLKKLNSIKDHLSILFYILLVISGVFYLLKSFITLDLKVIVYLLLTCIIGVVLSRIIKNNKYNSAIAAFVAIAICGLIFPQVQMDDSLFESSTVKTKITNYEKDIKDIAETVDFICFNLYFGAPITTDKNGTAVMAELDAAKTQVGWPVTPDAIKWTAKLLYERYNVPIYVSENGMACHDTVSLDGKVHDPNRVDYLNRYLLKLGEAIDEGADVRGYFVWSFMDNFEWAEGYDPRFGIVYVDYKTQKRIIKDSGYWYAKVIETGGKSLCD